MPLSVIAMFIGVFAFVGSLLYLSHRQWISVWRGHRIRIRLHHFKVFLDIDDVPVFCESQSFIRRQHQTEWEHPALGKKDVVITKVHRGQDGLSLNLEIGDEIVPLFELPSNWYGHVNLETEAASWKKLMPVDFEQLGDPRWIAACKILQLVRQSQMANKEIREAANILQQELRSNFETRRRLADEDLSILGNVDLCNDIKDKVEAKILQGLEAVKSLHMATISLEAHADETEEMKKVYDTIQSLQVQEEIASFMQKVSKNKPQKAAKALKKLL